MSVCVWACSVLVLDWIFRNKLFTFIWFDVSKFLHHFRFVNSKKIISALRSSNTEYYSGNYFFWTHYTTISNNKCCQYSGTHFNSILSHWIRLSVVWKSSNDIKFFYQQANYFDTNMYACDSPKPNANQLKQKENTGNEWRALWPVGFERRLVSDDCTRAMVKVFDSSDLPETLSPHVKCIYRHRIYPFPVGAEWLWTCAFDWLQKRSPSHERTAYERIARLPELESYRMLIATSIDASIGRKSISAFHLLFGIHF